MEAWVPDFAFYSGPYGGALPEPAFDEGLPAAVRLVRGLAGPLDSAALGEGALEALRRAACAAAQAYAEWGDGPAASVRVGSFSCGAAPGGQGGGAAAERAALAEMAWTGLAFCGAGR